ncbi:hypothetical protein FKR81_42985 [Lentzea tibetensis]|uniref:Uncharacterized protein n=1 Tax=Lentzea tibetensis TaxID=2591470 RepID=A0A563EDZ2_9PSEU|nr:hypothetical protein FKR81_42985 [Lentzea tibetensis]
MSSVLEWSESELGGAGWIDPDSGERPEVHPAENPVVRAGAVRLSAELDVVEAAEARVVFYRDDFVRLARERLATAETSASAVAKAISAVYAAADTNQVGSQQADKLRNLVEIAAITHQLSNTPADSPPARTGLEARLDQALQRSAALAWVSLPDWYTSAGQFTDTTLRDLDRLEAARVGLRDALDNEALYLDIATEQRDTARQNLSDSVEDLAPRLSSEQFACMTAAALVTTSPEITQPDTVRREAEHQAALMLQNKHIAARLLNAGVRVVIIPKDTPLTALPEFRHLAGTTTSDGRHWDDQNAAITGRTIAIRDNALTHLPHEIAHAIHEHALDDADKHHITLLYRDRLQQPDAPWPGNYASTNEHELFAQLSTTYTGTNHGHVTNNSHIWPHKKWPETFPLLRNTYGPNPTNIHQRHPATTDKHPHHTASTNPPSPTPAQDTPEPPSTATYAKMRSTGNNKNSQNGHSPTEKTSSTRIPSGATQQTATVKRAM